MEGLLILIHIIIDNITVYAKFRRIIRILKMYADKSENRALKYFRARFYRQNLFDFYKKSNKFQRVSLIFPRNELGAVHMEIVPVYHSLTIYPVI